MLPCTVTFAMLQYDDPNTSVNKMMLALKSLSFGLDFPASKLKQPSGDAVCCVLDFLTSTALAARGFTFRRPIYADEDTTEEAEVSIIVTRHLTLCSSSRVDNCMFLVAKCSSLA
jgi:intraflagellar transport protein 57